jgi:hypothetical protein
MDQTVSPATAISASQAPMRELVIAVNKLEDLFNAPDVNPLVDRDLRALGEPALDRAIRDLQSNGVRDRRPIRLRIDISAEQVASAGGTDRVAKAIHRYCVAKIADNAAAIHLTRRRARRGMQIAVALVAVFSALAYVLLTTVLAHAGGAIHAIVLGGLSVFAWVVLWDTLEAWIFDPIAPSFENRALSRLRDADVVVDVTSQDPEAQ